MNIFTQPFCMHDELYFHSAWASWLFLSVLVGGPSVKKESITLMQGIICMNNEHWIDVFCNINMCWPGQRLFPFMNISLYGCSIIDLIFRGENFQVKSSTTDLTAICLSGQFTPRWLIFIHISLILLFWIKCLLDPALLDQSQTDSCFQVQCHKWWGVPVPKKPKVSKKLVFKNVTKMKQGETHKQCSPRLQCRGASYSVKYPEPGSRLASWNINVPSLAHVSD